MKKILIFISFMISYSCFSTTLVIENQRQNERFMLFHLAVCNIPSSQYLKYYPPFNGSGGYDWYYFKVYPSSVFQITDNNFTNRQFPFLNTFPFAGNVYGGFGSYANLPLPTTNQEVNDSTNTERLQLVSMIFRIDGMQQGGLAMPPIYGGNNDEENNNEENNNQIIAYQENGYTEGTLNLFPNNPTYMVTYMRLGSMYYIQIS